MLLLQRSHALQAQVCENPKFSSHKHLQVLHYFPPGPGLRRAMWQGQRQGPHQSEGAAAFERAQRAPAGPFTS